MPTAHLRTMGGVGKTVDNLKTAIAGETHEFKKMYPEFIEVAKKKATKRLSAPSALPMRWRRFMQAFTRRRWTIWARMSTWTTTCVPCAA